MTVSGPAVVAQILVPLAVAFLTRLIASEGETAVAAFGIATRIESLALTLVMALSVVITPIAAKEFGAKSQDNIDKLIAFSGRLTVYWCLGVYFILAFFGQWIAQLFTDSQLAMDHPQITELDINPLIVQEEGEGCFAADVKVILGNN